LSASLQRLQNSAVLRRAETELRRQTHKCYDQSVLEKQSQMELKIVECLSPEILAAMQAVGARRDELMVRTKKLNQIDPPLASALVELRGKVYRALDSDTVSALVDARVAQNLALTEDLFRAEERAASLRKRTNRRSRTYDRVLVAAKTDGFRRLESQAREQISRALSDHPDARRAWAHRRRIASD
jgi:hypothetical protein